MGATKSGNLVELVYDIIRAEVPPGYELVTLERDDDALRLAKIALVPFVIVAATRLTRSLIEAAGRLELVHHQGVGYQDTIDLEGRCGRTARRWR